MIAYLWPLLIVVFSGVVHGGLRASHLAGGALGLAGAWLVISMRGGVALDSAYGAGYAAAAACALVVSGKEAFSWALAGAALLVAGGAALASGARR